MNSFILYFAYGSNMFPDRINQRCPGAIDLGKATLRDYRIAERLYADIDFEEGAEVEGVLYAITAAHLKRLDSFEGYPKVYRRMWLDVEFRGEHYMAVTYEMTNATKFARSGMAYPEQYREMCSRGARVHRIKNNFTTKRRKVTK